MLTSLAAEKHRANGYDSAPRPVAGLQVVEAPRMVAYAPPATNHTFEAPPAGAGWLDGACGAAWANARAGASASAQRPNTHVRIEKLTTGST